MVISAKQVLIGYFPHLRTPVGKWIRSSGLNLAAISALVEKILKRQNNFVPKTVNWVSGKCSIGREWGVWCDGPCLLGLPEESHLLKLSSYVWCSAQALFKWRHMIPRSLLPSENEFLGSWQCKDLGIFCPMTIRVSPPSLTGTYIDLRIPLLLLNYVSRENPLASQAFISSSVKK